MATESGTGRASSRDFLSPLAGFGIGLAAVTGLVHIRLFFTKPSTPIGIAWLLAGIGFFGAIVLFLIGFRRRLLSLIGIFYTGIQIAIFFYMESLSEFFNILPFIDKTFQGVLVVTLIVLYWRTRS